MGNTVIPEDAFVSLDRPIETFAQAAIRNASFGLSDVIQTKSGFRTPEELSGMSEVSPTADILGTGVGIIAPAIGTGGTSAIARGLRTLTPVQQGIARGAQTIEQALLKKFAVEAATSPAKKVLAGAAAKALAGSVEGGLHSIQPIISEAALGDPEEVAENAAATIGMGSLLSGGFSGALGVLAPGIRAIAKGAAPTARKYLDKAAKLSPDASKALRESPDEISKIVGLADNKPGWLQAQAEKIAAQQDQVVASYADDLSAKIDNLLAETNQSNKIVPAKELFEEIQKHKASISPGGIVVTPEDVAELKKLDDLSNFLGGIVRKNAGLADDAAFDVTEGYIKAAQANTIKTRYQKAGYTARRQGDPIGDLYKRLSGISNSLFEKHVDPELKKLNAGWAKFYDLEDDLKKFGLEDFNPEKIKRLFTTNENAYENLKKPLAAWDELLGTDLLKQVRNTRAANQAYSDDLFSGSFTGRSLYKPAVLGALGSIMGPAGVALGTAAGAALETPAGNRFANIYGHKAIDLLSKADVEAFRKLGGNEAMLLGDNLRPYLAAKVAALTMLQKEQEKVDREVKSSVSGFFETQAYQSPSSLGSVKRFKGDSADELARQLKDLIQSPGVLENRLQEQTEQLSLIAPQVSDRLVKKASEMVQFMYTKIPALQPEQGLFPSATQISQLNDSNRAKFERYLDAFDSPLNVFKDLKRKQVSPEGLEVVKRFYPKMFDKARNELLKQAEKKRNVSYQDKVMLSSVFDIAIDPSLRPESVQSLQKMFQNVDEQQSSGAKPISPKFAENKMSGTERVTARD